MALLKEEVQQDHGRVTQGLPSLDSPKRSAIAHGEAQQAYQQAVIADEKEKRELAVAPDGTRDVTNPEAQQGITLHSTHLMTRLLALNPALFFERALADPSVLGIYVLRPGMPGGRQFVCGFEADDSPEFEVVEYRTEERPTDDNRGFQTVKIATGTRRGWRTVLGRLIKAGLITEAGAFAMFGAPSQDSRNWQSISTK